MVGAHSRLKQDDYGSDQGTGAQVAEAGGGSTGMQGTAGEMAELGNPGLEGGSSGSFRARWEGEI